MTVHCLSLGAVLPATDRPRHTCPRRHSDDPPNRTSTDRCKCQGASVWKMRRYGRCRVSLQVSVFGPEREKVRRTRK